MEFLGISQCEQERQITIQVTLEPQEYNEYEELRELVLNHQNHDTELGRTISDILCDNGWSWSNNILMTHDWNTMTDVLNCIRMEVRNNG